MRLEEAAPAKINLALHVRRRRGDGYHDLETLFAFVDIADRLSAKPAVDISLTIIGPEAGGLAAAGDNLVLRAAAALARESGITQGARLVLDKQLPVSSGIGGGSADAAAALRLLNRLWALDWPLERLEPLARGLGADVPACLYSRSAFGDGIGADLSPIEDGALPPLTALLVNCRQPVPTGAVFAGWDGFDRGGLLMGDPLATAFVGRNDLQTPATRIVPEIEETLALLGTLSGATLIRMSGSGATCFALFAKAEDGDAGLARVRSARPGWWSKLGRLK